MRFGQANSWHFNILEWKKVRKWLRLGPALIWSKGRWKQSPSTVFTRYLKSALDSRLTIPPNVLYTVGVFATHAVHNQNPSEFNTTLLFDMVDDISERLNFEVEKVIIWAVCIIHYCISIEQVFVAIRTFAMLRGFLAQKWTKDRFSSWYYCY